MNLRDLLDGVHPVEIKGTQERDVKQLSFDSRLAEADSAFVAIRGAQVDGHKFIDKAIANGANVIVAEEWPPAQPATVTWVRVTDSPAALGIMAGNFYGKPSHQLQLVGVTGTNGKTTVATLLHDLFTSLGYKAGLISTIENKIGQRVHPARYTTPDAVGVNALLAEMVDTGCEYVFMEVSSHAAHQKRIDGLRFRGAIFTNITHDHLDYHKTFKAYIEAKKRFFDILPASAFALVNIDDKRGEVMIQNTRARKLSYSLRRPADFRARLLENAVTGLHLELDGEDFFGRLIGDFNAYNLLAVYAAARLLAQDRLEVLAALSRLGAAEGRLDYVRVPGQEITGIVDYAHTPDALEKVLQTLNQLRQGDGRIITLTGCGGDRDKAKRPKMAKVACDYSEQVILTSDNPRTEDPLAILADMEAGVPPYATRKVLTIVSRREAIRTACRLARPGDLILVAGKGHEKYQEINGERTPFDDKALLWEELEMQAQPPEH